MTILVNSGLSAPHRTVIMRAAVAFAAFVLLCSLATGAGAQEPAQGKRDDLDVTMQIIADPDAKLPDEVVRRIPLPTRKSADPAASGPIGAEPGKSESAGPKDPDRERGNETREHGRENAEAARERAREAAEQREAARRAEAEERRRERGPPDDRPDPPNRPPRN